MASELHFYRLAILKSNGGMLPIRHVIAENGLRPCNFEQLKKAEVFNTFANDARFFAS